MGDGRRPLAALAASVPFLLSYTLEGQDWTWQTHPVEDEILLNTGSFASSVGSTAEVFDALDGALSVWTDEGEAAVSFLPGESTTSTSWTYDELDVLQYSTTTGSGGTLAVCQYWYYDSYVLDCDIRFYARNAYGAIAWSADPSGPSSSEYDLETVAIHELGHCLGLDHSTDADARMYAYAWAGAADRHLGEDDIDGLQAIYGASAVELEYSDHEVDDDASGASSGDGDGVIDSGETIELDVEIHNSGLTDAFGVQVSLSSGSPDVLITDDAAYIGTVAAGDYGDTWSSDDRFVFDMVSTCSGSDSATFTLTIEDSGGDTWTDSLTLTLHCDPDDDGDGYPASDDCDDGDASIHPGATELPGDGVDQDCDGAETCYDDDDDDGWRPDATSIVVSADPDCTDPGEATASDPTTDCDDADASIHPGAVDVAGDGIDQDCDGTDPSVGDENEDGNGDALAACGCTSVDPARPGLPLGVTLALLLAVRRDRPRTVRDQRARGGWRGSEGTAASLQAAGRDAAGSSGRSIG